MCGIAGILRWDGVSISKAMIASFTDSLEHRGPDGKGIWIAENSKIGLGHRRLAILDLTDAAAQPFHDNESRYVLTYNGEIFNFPDLKKELEGIGFVFKTDSDTEVLINAWAAWGVNCLRKFNGMWAFGIWDKIDQTLWLCRDRYGVKPLYTLNERGKFLAFASETQAFKYIDGYHRKANPDYLNIAIQRPFALEGSGKTPFQNIHPLLAGHWMKIDMNGNCKTQRWWNTCDELLPAPTSYQEALETLDELFTDACRIRMRSDVPITSALSGGIDSSAVFSRVWKIGNEQTHDRLHERWSSAFTASFPGTQYDETEYARIVTRHLGADLLEVAYDPLKIVDRVISDTIRFDSVYLVPVTVGTVLYQAMQVAGIRVSLDGSGPDELMYGYPHLVADAWNKMKTVGNSEYANDIENTYLNLFRVDEHDQIRSGLHAQFNQTEKNKPKRTNAQKIYDQFVPSFLKNAYRKYTNAPSLTPSWYNHIIKGQDAFNYNEKHAEALLYHEFHYGYMPTILRNFDRATMMSGIESRMPFMDYRIVNYMFSMPMEYKLGSGYTKRILRDIIRKDLPPQITDRTWKVGFNPPMTEWFDGPLKEWLADTVNEKSFVESAFWNGKEIQKYTHQKLNSNSSWHIHECMTLWPVLSSHLILKSK
jgi:asparagine synthase (glutamine-hydrolysing)